MCGGLGTGMRDMGMDGDQDEGHVTGWGQGRGPHGSTQTPLATPQTPRMTTPCCGC